MDFQALHANYVPGSSGAPVAAVAGKRKPNFIQSLFPSIGGIAGGVGGGAAGGALAGTAILPGVGTVAGGLLGALLGGGIGGAAGKAVENRSLGESLGHGVVKEGLVQGALSAGPIRLLKGATAGGRALLAGGEALGADAATQGGGKLVSALNAGGAAATRPSAIKTAVAGKLDTVKDTLGAKVLGLSAGEKSKILQKTGEKAGSIATRYGIRHADDVAKVAEPLFGEYASAVGSIPRTFTKQEVGDAFKAVYQPLMKKGIPLGKQTEGKALKAEADNLLRGIGKEIAPADLNAMKTGFDDLAYKFKLTDPTSHNVNKAARDVIHGLISDAADNAGVTTSKGSLKELGSELIKLKRLGDAAGKHLDGAGGSTLLGLGPLPGVGIGAAGGPAGAALGGAFNMALNSPTGRKALATGAEKVAARSAGAAAKSGTENYTIKNVAKRVLPAGLVGALASGNQSPNNMQARPSNNTDPIISNIDSPYADTEQPSTSNNPFAVENARTNVEKILTAGGKAKDVQEYLGLVEALQKLEPAAPKPLNSTAAGTVTDLQNGIANIGQLSDDFASSSVNSPLLGRLRSANPFDTQAKTLKANVARVKQVIGKALEGGVLRKEDEIKYAAILPTLSDTDEVAQNKINAIMGDLQRKLQLYQANIGNGGGGSYVTPQ